MSKILSFVGGFLVIVFALEFFLKFSEIKLPYKTLDPQIGKTYQSNVPINEIREGFYMGETNSDGFIGKSSAKKNIFRIALFGDSYTEGFQLFEPYKFSRILEKSLNNKSEIEVEILNFGISNVVLPEMYIRKKRLAKKFNIDLFVYVFDNSDFDVEPEGILNSVELIAKNNNLIIVPNTSKQYQFYKKMQFVIDKSSYLNFTLDAYLLVRRGKAMPLVFDKFYPKKKQLNQDSTVRFNYLSDKNLKIISEMQKDKSVFVFRGNPNEKLKSKLLPFNIPIIGTRQALNSLKNKKINPYYWKLTQTTGHLNYDGNRVLGIYLSDQLLPFIKKQWCHCDKN